MREVSIGDYVLSGGEIAAMVLIDACVRLLPGVIGAKGSLREESFESGLLEYPQYTKPREWEGAPSPKCCYRATTSGSPSGAAARPSASPPSAAPTSGKPSKR